MENHTAIVTCHNDRNIICLDRFTYKQWRMISIKENLPNDVEISKFLIHLYNTNKGHEQPTPHCAHCGSPITPICHICQTGSLQPCTEFSYQSPTEGNKDPVSKQTSKDLSSDVIESIKWSHFQEPGCGKEHWQMRKQQKQGQQLKTQATGRSSTDGLSVATSTSVSASHTNNENDCETKKEEKDPKSDFWTYKEISTLHQYIMDRQKERKTRLFWQTCADVLNAHFGVRRTASACRMQYSQQGKLTSDLQTQNTTSETKVIVGTKSKKLGHLLPKSDIVSRSSATDKNGIVQEDSYSEDEDIVEEYSYFQIEDMIQTRCKQTGRKRRWELGPTCCEINKNSPVIVETSQDSNGHKVESSQITDKKMSKISSFNSASKVKSSGGSIETLNTSSLDSTTKLTSSRRDFAKMLKKSSLDAKLKSSHKDIEMLKIPSLEADTEIQSLEDDVEKHQNPVDYHISKNDSLPPQTERPGESESCISLTQIPSSDNSNEDHSEDLLNMSGLNVSQPTSSKDIEGTQTSKVCNTVKSKIFLPQTQITTSVNSSINHALDTSTSEPAWIYIGVADLNVQLLSKDHSSIHCQRRQRKHIHNPSSNQQQQRRHGSINIYKCKECGKAFQKREGLINHIRWVHCEWRPFHCTLCPSAFRSRSRLQRHVCVAHTKVRPYHCEICSASFVDRCALNTHALTHQVDRPYRYFCECCGKGYHGLKGLKRHLVSHSEVKRGPPIKTVLCWVCGKAVASTTYLKLHLKTHSPESVITCTICHQNFVSKWALDKHLTSLVHLKRLDKKNDFAVDKQEMKETHLEQSEKVCKSSGNKTQSRNGAFKCDVCEKSFSSKKSVSRHRRAIHPLKYNSDNVESEQDHRHQSRERELAGSCAPVQNSTKKQNLETGVGHIDRNHEVQMSGVQIPDNEKLSLIPRQANSDPASHRFRCDICLQTFSLQQNLRRHKRNVHFGGREFRCDLCEKSFKENYCLKQHKNIFHNPAGQIARQTVNCDICDKTFLAKSAMTMHKRTVHYGLKKESCSVCFKGFRDKFTLERHRKSCQRKTTVSSNKEEVDNSQTLQTQKDSEMLQTQVVKTQETGLSMLGSVSVPSDSSTASCFTSLHLGCPWSNLVPTFESTDRDSDPSQLGRNLVQFVSSVETGTVTSALETVDLWNMG